MGVYRVNLTFAPQGGSRLRQGEIVEIDDADLGPYEQYLTRGWLSPDAGMARLGVAIPPLPPHPSEGSVLIPPELADAGLAVERDAGVVE